MNRYLVKCLKYEVIFGFFYLVYNIFRDLLDNLTLGWSFYIEYSEINVENIYPGTNSFSEVEINPLIIF